MSEYRRVSFSCQRSSLRKLTELRCSGEGQRREMLRPRGQRGQRQRTHEPVKGTWGEGGVGDDVEGPRAGQASQGHEGCA